MSINVEYIPKVITTFGLTFDIAGVLFLAYDLFWSSGNKFQTEVLKNQLRNEIFLHKSILSDFDKLSHSIGEKRAAPHINKANDRHEIAKKKLMTSIKEIQSQYPKRIRLWGFRGLILVVIGFLLQIVGTILS